MHVHSSYTMRKSTIKLAIFLLLLGCEKSFFNLHDFITNRYVDVIIYEKIVKSGGLPLVSCFEDCWKNSRSVFHSLGERRAFSRKVFANLYISSRKVIILSYIRWLLKCSPPPFAL